MGEMERSACRELPESLREEVLARLPLKSLCRSRCVSKEWNALISSTRFITTNWAPNRNPYLVVQSWDLKSNMLGSMAYCFFTQTWHKIPSISLSSLAQKRPFCFGSSAGLCLAYTANAFVVFNPLTRTSVQLPPLPSVPPEDIPAEIGIIGGEADSPDTYKVVAVADQSRFRECTVQAYNSTDKSWRNVGHIPVGISRLTGPKVRVFCGDSYYCLTLDSDIMGFSFTNGTCITAPLPEKAVYFTDIKSLNLSLAIKDCKSLYLFVCRSRVLLACCISDWGEPHLQEVITWEFQKEKVDDSSSSSSSRPWWKEIGRMPPSMCQDLNRSANWNRFMRCEGVGNYACFIFTVYTGAVDVGAVDVVVYSITERAWSWLPTCPINEDAFRGVIWAGEFEPRPDMMVH